LETFECLPRLGATAGVREGSACEILHESRLETENAALRRRLIFLRRKVKGRAPLRSADCRFFVHLHRWFPWIEPRALIRQLGVENPLWDAPRILGELLKLGFEVAQPSVAKWMVKRWAAKPGMARLSA
jgi:hypothetical protein